jgi:hypothetical protein
MMDALRSEFERASAEPLDAQHTDSKLPMHR